MEVTPPDPDEPVKIAQAAVLAGVSQSTIHTWINRGAVPIERRGVARTIFVRPSAVRAAAAAIRPRGTKRGTRATYKNSAEMTQAEVDALVAEQLAHKPAWWDADARRMAGKRAADLIRGDE